MRNRTSRIEDVLEKLFEVVGQEYSEDFCKESEWYLKYSWTEEQEESFKDWLISYIRNKDKTTIKEAKRQAGLIILNYGWKGA